MSLADQECQRYYQPWLSAHGSSDAVAQHLASVARLGYTQKVFEQFPSRDPILIAFAQNVCYRLGVRRCMISLLDSTNQYVLGEATRSYSSRCPDGSEGDEIWMGSAILARPEAMCEHSLAGRCQALSMALGGRRYSTDGMIINDARCDSRFENRPYVLQEEGSRVRFYAGVPLVSRNGHKIGVLAATDENPRNGLELEELGYMEDMARCAMEHLEWARDRVDRFKGDRIVRGMATFIEEASLLQADIVPREMGRDRSLGGLVDDEPVSPGHDQSAEKEISEEPTSPVHDQTRESHTEENTMGLGGDETSATGTSNKSKGPPGIPEDADIFAKASAYLRDATLADGCVIFGSTTTSMSESFTRADPEQSDGRSSPGYSSVDGTPMNRPCKILSLNTAHPSVKTSLDSDSESPFRLETLYEYFESFPKSVALYFSEDGTLVSSPEGNNPLGTETAAQDLGLGRTTTSTSRAGRPRSRKADHRELLQKLRGMRTLMFLPLWDPYEEKLVAGVFLWSLTPGRLAGTDLSHIQAFADSIVSQIVRMDIQRNEAAKTTFIASMSHELRSPLHGILGAAEFLVESTTNAYETGLIMSIITCGRTLLETLSHVLEYSKINNLGVTRTKTTREGRRSLGPDATSDNLDRMQTVDLGALLEDVAESVTAGHTYQHQSSTRKFSSFDSRAVTYDPPMPSMPDDYDSRESLGVTVLLDVTPLASWAVKTEPGAIQRIVMNLFGNALKYTSSGFVAMSLRALKSKKDDKLSVLLRVADSGKGIGESYQRNKLFVPFSQEDSFQPGSGLGLSIVKQIVESIGGTIEVDSTPGKGTNFDVYLQLTPAADHMAECQGDESQPSTLTEQIREVHEQPLLMTPKLVGKKIVLLDPLDPDKTRSPTHQASRFQHMLRDTCEKWFGMQVCRSTNMGEKDDVDIYLYGEPPPIEMLRHHKRLEGRQPVPVVLACQNNHDARAVVRDRKKFLRELGEVVEVIQQPCGPRKLAKTFLYCLTRAEERLDDKTRAAKASQVEGTNMAVRGRAAELRNERPMLVRSISDTRVRQQEMRKDVSAALALPTPPTINPATPSWGDCETGDTTLDLLASPEKPQPAQSGAENVPLASDSTTAAAEQQKAVHLLVVDDNKINRQLLIMFIKKCGFTYQEAENGQEAVDLFSPTCASNNNGDKHGDGAPSEPPTALDIPSPPPAAPKFDHILMDISMPVMDGLEATRRIRALEQASGMQRTQILALTALASDKARADAETSGVDVFLPKPVKFAQLKSMLV